MGIHGVHSGGIELPKLGTSAGEGNSNRGISLNGSRAEANKAINAAPLPFTRGLFGSGTKGEYVGTNNEDGKQYSMQISKNVFGGNNRIQLLREGKKESGYAEYKEKNEGMNIDLKTIDTQSSEGGKGRGAMLVYQLANQAKKDGINQIHVPNATPEERGFYEAMGFKPEAAHKQMVTDAGMDEKFAWTQLSGDVDTVLTESGHKVANNWTNTNGPAEQTWTDYLSSLVGWK